MTNTDLAAVMSAVARRAREEAATVPAAQSMPVKYLVSCLPEDHDERGLFTLQVEYRGRDLWAVTNGSGSCLSRQGTWDFEHIPSERTDEWLASHRFDLDTALRLAREAAPLVTVNGFTVSDAIAMDAERKAGAS